MKKIFLCLSFLTVLLASAQESAKLAKDRGFNALKIGANYTAVKTLLQPNSIDFEEAFEPEFISRYLCTGIYLVNLKSPGYDKILGLPVDRIEVHFKDDDKGGNVISEVKIYFKRKSAHEDTYDLFFDAYGEPVIENDIPEENDMSFMWVSPKVILRFTVFDEFGVGSETYKERTYMTLQFSSAVGG